MNVGTSSGEIWRALIEQSGIAKVQVARATLDFSSIAANLAASLTITVHDVNPGDLVVATPASNPNNAITWSAFVSAKDTVTVRTANNSAGAVDQGAIEWTVLVFKLTQ